MNYAIPRISAIMSVSALLAGCPLEISVPSGGRVVSDSGVRDCATFNGTGNVCVYDIPDTTFIETFTASPDRGYRFIRWESGPEYQCSGSTDPVCVVDMTQYSGNATVEGLLASSAVGRMEPVFEVAQRQTFGVLTAGGIHDFNYKRQGQWTSFGSAIGIYNISIPVDCSSLQGFPAVQLTPIENDLSAAENTQLTAQVRAIECSNDSLNIWVKTFEDGIGKNLSFAFSFVDPLYPE
tara:strand:+ start:39146 stop:39856 length:711 start_codon:yes stop_codon:yes gene_type:complete